MCMYMHIRPEFLIAHQRFAGSKLAREPTRAQPQKPPPQKPPQKPPQQQRRPGVAGSAGVPMLDRHKSVPLQAAGGGAAFALAFFFGGGAGAA